MSSCSTGVRADILRVSVKASEHRHVSIMLDGELDIASAPLLSTTFEAVLAHANAIVIDLDQVSFIDSSGLMAILACEIRCQQHGTAFGLTEGSRQVRRVFEVTGVAERLPFLARFPRGAPRRSACGPGIQPPEASVREAARRLRNERHGRVRAV
jgi:anti-sigma B factor antagonist